MRQLIVCCMLIWCGSCTSKATEIILAANGSSNYSIVLSKNATSKEKKAADIIKKYFRQVTEVNLPVVTEGGTLKHGGIYIGQTQKYESNTDGKIKNDGYTIAVHNGDLILHGGSGQGIIYAAYGFVDKYLGCRKYDNGPAVCPSRKTLTLPAEVFDLQNPSFIYRQSYYPPSNDAEYLQWHHLQQFEDLWGIWGHSFFKIISPEEYFTSHPEYFSLINGKRSASQLCLSNPDVLKLTIDYLKKATPQKPDAIYWSVAQNDGEGYCQCELCKKTDQENGSPSGSIINFVNKIAYKFPDQKFTTLAYGYSSHAPQHIQPAGNVIVFLSSIKATRSLPVEQAPGSAEFRADLLAWTKLTPHVFIWDYSSQFTHYLTPFPIHTVTAANLQFYKRHKVEGVFIEGSGDVYSDMAELNSYTQAAALWDTSNDIKSTTTDFITGYYHKAGPFIEQYQEALGQAVRATHTELDIYGNPVNDYSNYLSPPAMQRYKQIMDKASVASSRDTLIQTRVQRVQLGLNYVQLQQAKAHSDLADKNKQPLLTDFLLACRQLGISALNEDGLTTSSFKQNWNQLQAEKPKYNLAKNAKAIFTYPFSEDYPAKREKTLTDGVYGTTDYSFNWLFMYNQDLEVVIDLGRVQEVNIIKANFLDDARHHIFMPDKVSVSTSVDGKDYAVFNSRAEGLPCQTQVSINHVQFKGNTKARFIKMRAACLKIMPDCIPYTTKKPALCCDEITVE